MDATIRNLTIPQAEASFFKALQANNIARAKKIQDALRAARRKVNDMRDLAERDYAYIGANPDKVHHVRTQREAAARTPLKEVIATRAMWADLLGEHAAAVMRVLAAPLVKPVTALGEALKAAEKRKADGESSAASVPTSGG